VSSDAPTPVFVTFLSDFGLTDDFVGTCHGVINMLCPQAQVIHVTHGIRPQAVGQGSRVLAGAIRYLPRGVHLAVVDPGVGSERRAVALRSGDGRLFVGPDNGLLVPAAELCGGVAEAVSLENPDYMLHPVSRTFHGRDVFSPAAAHLGLGVALGELGPSVDPADLVRRDDPGHTLSGSLLEAEVQYIDRYGNVQLAVAPEELGDLFVPGELAEIVTGDDRYYARCAETFADVEAGEIVLYQDASGLLSVAINRGDAAELTAIEVGDRLGLELAPEVDLESFDA
jgi:S-adenosyl-L-methionine hydrolase (adenosine-forming)